MQCVNMASNTNLSFAIVYLPRPEHDPGAEASAEPSTPERTLGELCMTADAMHTDRAVVIRPWSFLRPRDAYVSMEHNNDQYR